MTAPTLGIIRLEHAEGLELPAYETSGFTSPNTPEKIDSDYRGEVKVLLINLGDEDFRIERGMRIAQAVFAPVVQPKIEERSQVSQTARGAGGFGSTGTA